MKILITSGGTTEKIDSVRGITNHSTGHLGKKIAELFLAKGHQVTLVTTKAAVKPEPKENLKITEITNVESLLETMEPLVKEHDVLIHSMAVSDYTPVYMTNFEVARTSLKRNQADLIVANDLSDISANQHIAYLVDEQSQEKVSTKSEIAQALYERICHD